MSLLSAISIITLAKEALALVEKVTGGIGTALRIKRQKEKDAEIDAKGDVDEKDLKERLRGRGK